MRCLERDKTIFYYALFDKREAIKDSNGKLTGERRVVYKTPVKMRAHVSAATGKTQIEQFGTLISYDKVITSDNLASPISESSVLCIDSPPSYDSDGNLIYDYIVKKVGRYPNTVSYAISKVDVS